MTQFSTSVLNAFNMSVNCMWKAIPCLSISFNPESGLGFESGRHKTLLDNLLEASKVFNGLDYSGDSTLTLMLLRRICLLLYCHHLHICLDQGWNQV